MKRPDPRLLRWTLIGLVAVGLRLHRLDARSLWFDEVTTMRLAEEPTPRALVALLDRIDGSRGPLHPLMLQGWLKVFGDSALAARSLSAVLGVATVALVLVLGRRAWGEEVGEWAAWFCAVCPPLVYYSQEVRMYALVVLATVASWLALEEARRRDAWAAWVVYGVSLAALGYAHPLGLFMVAAHVLIGSAGALAGVLPRWRWAASTMLGGLLVLPWLPRYLDHDTDYPIPLYSIRYLLAAPIEFIGGNSLTLIPWGAVILAGLIAIRDGRVRARTPIPSAAALSWLVVPPTLMFAYSWLHRPIFGQPRYHLFVAPAYFLLIAAGMVALPVRARWLVGVAVTALACHGLATTTYAPNHKADWRSAAAWLGRAGDNVVLIVHPDDPRFTREPIGTARYYLEPRVRVEPVEPADAPGPDVSRRPGTIVYHAHCFPPTDWSPPDGEVVVAEFYGLTITRAEANGPAETGGTTRSLP